MAEQQNTPLLQEYPLPKSEEEKSELTWSAYFFFLVLVCLTILATKLWL